MTPLRMTVEVSLSCHPERSEGSCRVEVSLSCHPERSEGSQARGEEMLRGVDPERSEGLSMTVRRMKSVTT